MSANISASFSRSLINLEELYAEARKEISASAPMMTASHTAVQDLKVTVENKHYQTQVTQDENSWIVILDDSELMVEDSHPEAITEKLEAKPKSDFRLLVETVIFGMIGVFRTPFRAK